MDRSIDTISNLVLLKLYECSAISDSLTWSFESAIRAVGHDNRAEIGDAVFKRFVNKGWIAADHGFAPYDVDKGIAGPDLSGERAVKLTQRGKDAALAILELRQSKPVSQRLHAINWTTWGGIAAIIGLIVAIITLIAS